MNSHDNAVKALRQKAVRRAVDMTAHWEGELFEISLSKADDATSFEFTVADASPETSVKAAEMFLDAVCPPKPVGAPKGNRNRARRAA